MQSLITNFDKETGQAEQMCQAEPEPVDETQGRAEQQMRLKCQVTLCQAEICQDLNVTKCTKQARVEETICKDFEAEKSRML